MDANTFSYLRARQRTPSAVRPPQASASPSAQPKRRPLLRRIFGREEITTFQRCLAIHMHYAQRNSFLR
jgi:hypothetical protein